MAVSVQPIAPADPHAEAPATLAEAAPRTLGLFDQFGFWGNLGVSLFGLTTASTVLLALPGQPLPLPAALLAVLTGTVIGGVILGISLMLGARTGAPAMVLLRGVLGARASYLPTVLNIVQNLGWGTFEVILIAESLRSVLHQHLDRWVCVLLAGVLTTALTIRPLGAIRVIRRYVTALVVVATVVLAIGLLRQHIPAVPASAHPSWHGFWLGVDAVVAVSISWVPLGADYSRHSRTERSAFLGGFIGYGLTQIACYAVGLLALLRVLNNPDGIFDFYLTLPLGTIALIVLVLRETDQSFANTYSTAISVQNLRPNWDRRVLSTMIGAVITLAALKIHIGSYLNFLSLIGGVFVPLSGVLVAAWLRTRGDGWDLSTRARTRPGLLIAWLVGFICYQLVNPGYFSYWSDFWTRAGTDLHTLGHTWLSASITAFLVSVALAYPWARLDEQRTGSRR
ncbi:MAG TPA: cytosine permease [Jatrophihabitans sp.]|nr:cytosine permease [Jatrophihabitans sp.]